MNIKVQLISATLIALITSTQCANILIIFSSPSKSHSILGKNLAVGLVNRGHNVTLVTPYNVSPTTNMTVIQLKSILEYKQNLEKEFLPDKGSFKIFLNLINMFQDINSLFWEEQGIRDIILNKPKYDTVILGFFFNDAILGIPHHLGVPSIIFSGIGYNSMTNKYVANINAPYAKNPLVDIPTDNFLGRLATVTINTVINLWLDYWMNPIHEQILRKHLPDSPPLEELQKNISLMLLNSHISIESAKPYLPNMIQIGGYHVRNEELPEDIKNFMENATDGVILFSLGSNIFVSTMKREKQDAIFKVLEGMAPIKVVFKSDVNYDRIPDNMLVRKWLPQSDILAHPNLIAFVSHGGLGGNTEAVYHGVPILGMPIAGDQKMNVAEAVAAGYAIGIDYEGFTEDLFREKLAEIVNNSTYRENARKRSALMKDQPMKPMDNAAFWIEHIIKYGGGSHLKNDGINMTWYQLYMIDIFAFYAIILSLVILSNYFVMKYFLKMIRKLFTRNKVKTS